MYYISFLFYVMSLLLYAVFYKKRANIYSDIGFILAVLGFASDLSRFVFDVSAAMTMSVTFTILSLGTTLVFMIIELRLKRTRILGTVIMPFIMVFSFMALLSAGKDIHSSEVTRAVTSTGGFSWWMLLHIFSALIGYGAFIASALIGVLFIIGERQLKSHQPGNLFYSLPDFGTLSKLNFRYTLIGWLFFTISIVLGHYWFRSLSIKISIDSPKVALTHLTWSIYTFLLFSQIFLGWKGRKAAVGSIIGIFSILVTFLGINLFSNGLHSFRSF